MTTRAYSRWLIVAASCALLVSGQTSSAAHPQRLSLGPPPDDDPSEISAADLAVAATESGVGNEYGDAVLYFGAWEDAIDAICEMYGFAVCPPADDEHPKDNPDVIPIHGDSTTPEAPPPPPPPKPPQNEDVIPIRGDSSAPVDEVVGLDPDLAIDEASGPFVDPIERLASPADGWRERSPRLDKPVMFLTQTGAGLFELRAYSAEALPLVKRLDLLKIRGVIVPLSPSRQRALQQWMAANIPPGSHVHLARVPMRGYCVDAMKPASTPGTMFALAPRALQEQLAPMRPVRDIAVFAATRGYLKPQGDPAAYGEFITQYAIWTTLEHWDRARFTDEFVTRSRQAMGAAHKPWSSETEQTLRALAPQRWRDVRLVMLAAGKAQARQRTKLPAGGSR